MSKSRFFTKNGLVWMACGRISREKGWSGWPGGVFLEKKAGLDGLGAHFLRKKLVWMAWERISQENHRKRCTYTSFQQN